MTLATVRVASALIGIMAMLSVAPCLAGVKVGDAPPDLLGRDFMKRQLAGLDLTITRDKTWKVIEDFGVKDIPSMFMIDKAGHVAHIHVGYGEQALDSLVKEVNELLAQQTH